eukprot:jgi/Orpsp1_1/1176951/evm.model.c7180000059609.1
MSDFNFFKTQMPDISSKFHKIIKMYKDLIVDDEKEETKKQILHKFIQDYYEYVFELLYFICRIKNAGYLKKDEDQYFIEKYIMPKIDNDILINNDGDDNYKKELKYYLKEFFIDSSAKFKAGEHLNMTLFNIKMDNLMNYNDRRYNIK